MLTTEQTFGPSNLLQAIQQPHCSTSGNTFEINLLYLNMFCTEKSSISCIFAPLFGPLALHMGIFEVKLVVTVKKILNWNAAHGYFIILGGCWASIMIFIFPGFSTVSPNTHTYISYHYLLHLNVEKTRISSCIKRKKYWWETSYNHPPRKFSTPFAPAKASWKKAGILDWKISRQY